MGDGGARFHTPRRSCSHFVRRRGSDYLRELCRHPGASVRSARASAHAYTLVSLPHHARVGRAGRGAGRSLTLLCALRWPLIAAMAVHRAARGVGSGVAPGDGSRRALTLAAMRLVGLVWVSPAVDSCAASIRAHPLRRSVTAAGERRVRRLASPPSMRRRPRDRSPALTIKPPVSSRTASIGLHPYEVQALLLNACNLKVRVLSLSRNQGRDDDATEQ
jgi:hypothetical protein